MCCWFINCKAELPGCNRVLTVYTDSESVLETRAITYAVSPVSELLSLALSLELLVSSLLLSILPHSSIHQLLVGPLLCCSNALHLRLLSPANMSWTGQATRDAQTFEAHIASCIKGS